MVIKIKDGWVLTNKGIEYLKTKKLTNHSPTAKQHLDLDKLARKIKSPYVQDFVIEAVSCIENNLLKSAVVFSWVGAISVLYEYVEANKLKQFNLEAKKRDNRWKDAINIEGLSKMKEYDFLQIIEGI